MLQETLRAALDNWNEVPAQYQHICIQRHRVYVFDMIHGHGKIISNLNEQNYWTKC